MQSSSRVHNLSEIHEPFEFSLLRHSREPVFGKARFMTTEYNILYQLVELQVEDY